MVWLIYSDEELLVAKRNRLAVNRIFSGRRFAGCLPFFRVRTRWRFRKARSGCGGGSTDKILDDFLIMEPPRICLLHRHSLVESGRPSERSKQAPARKQIANGCHHIHAACKNNINKVQSEQLASFKIARSKPLICKEFSKPLDDGLYIKY